MCQQPRCEGVDDKPNIKAISGHWTWCFEYPRIVDQHIKRGVLSGYFFRHSGYIIKPGEVRLVALHLPITWQRGQLCCQVLQLVCTATVYQYVMPGLDQSASGLQANAIGCACDENAFFLDIHVFFNL